MSPWTNLSASSPRVVVPAPTLVGATVVAVAVLVLLLLLMTGDDAVLVVEGSELTGAVLLVDGMGLT